MNFGLSFFSRLLEKNIIRHAGVFCSLSLLSFAVVDSKPLDPVKVAEDQFHIQRLHADCIYHVYGCTRSGHEIQLFDRSKWSVTPHKQAMVTYWKKAHEIFIKPAYSCFWPSSLTTYKYVLYNRFLNETAEVYLLSKPLYLTEGTFQVVSINAFQRLIQLSDNTWWNIDPKDKHFSSWKEGHRIIVGVNNHWREADYPHILINVDLPKEPYSPAILYPYP